MAHARNFKDLTGQKIARLTFLEFVDTTEQGIARWKVRCDCGVEFVTVGVNIIRGNTKSCGCLRVEMLRARNKKQH